MLDIDHINTNEWTQRDYPIPARREKNKVGVVIARSVLNEISAHGKSRMDVEVCGVLVGDAYQDIQGPFIYVDASIRGLHSDNQVAQVTFTAETWAHIQKQLDDKYSDRRIIGWYHTHPGFGIFLSGMDMFIHENFFNTAEQLAVVYDPHSGEEGLFVWRDGNAKREKIVVHENAPAEHPSDEPVLPPPVPRLLAAAGDDALRKRVRTLERRQQLLTLALIAVALIAFALPVLLSSMLGDNRPRPNGIRWIKGKAAPTPEEVPKKSRAEDKSHGGQNVLKTKPPIAPQGSKESEDALDPEKRDNRFSLPNSGATKENPSPGRPPKVDEEEVDEEEVDEEEVDEEEVDEEEVDDEEVEDEEDEDEEDEPDDPAENNTPSDPSAASPVKLN